MWLAVSSLAGDVDAVLRRSLRDTIHIVRKQEAFDKVNKIITQFFLVNGNGKNGLYLQYFMTSLM